MNHQQYKLMSSRSKPPWLRLMVLILITTLAACQSNEPPTASTGKVNNTSVQSVSPTPTPTKAATTTPESSTPPPTPTIISTAAASPTASPNLTATPPPTNTATTTPTATPTETSLPTNTPKPTATLTPAVPAVHTAQIDCSDPVVTGPPPDVSQPTALRDDIQIRKIIETPGRFVRIAQDPLSNDIFYMDVDSNIYRLNLQPNDASSAKQIYSLAEIGGGAFTLGLTFGPDGTLYVVGNDSQGDETRAIIRKGVPNETGVHQWSTLATTAFYPKSNTPFDHVFSGIVVSPDGQSIYISSGSRTDHGEVQSSNGLFPGVREVPLTAAIFRLPTEASDLFLANDEAELNQQGYLFVQGMRNAFDLAFAPNGDLIAAENGPDSDYPEELNWVREGHHYGFPWRMGGFDNQQQFADYDPNRDPWLIADSIGVAAGAYHNDPTFPPRPAVIFTEPIPNLGPDGDNFRDLEGCEHDASTLGLSLGTFTSHRSPLGLVFDTAGILSEEFRNDGFMLSFGPAYAGALTDRGQDLLHLELTKQDTSYQVQTTQIVHGFDFPIDSVLIENKLYVLTFGTQALANQGIGTIWEIALP